MTLTPERHREIVAAFPRATRAPLYTGAMFLFILLAVTLIIWATTSSLSPTAGTYVVPMIVVAFLLALLSGVALSLHLDRTHRARFKSLGAALGLECVTKPPRSSRAALFAPFSTFPMLKKGHNGVKLWAGGEIDSRRIDLIEHVHIINTGKSAQAVTHTAIATPCPDSWTRLSLTPRHVFSKLWESIAGKDFQVETPAFNDRWTIKTDNPDFALLFLTPEIQHFLADAPSAETWHVGAGSLCWMVRKRLHPRELPPHIHRVAELRNLLPPELDYWTP